MLNILPVHINEYYKDCGTACPERCDYKLHICMSVCAEGCFCNSGYVRQGNSANSPCIEQNKC